MIRETITGAPRNLSVSGGLSVSGVLFISIILASSISDIEYPSPN